MSSGFRVSANDVRFVALRFDTPHPIIDLHEVGSDLVWRVKAEALEVERATPVAVASDLIRDRLRCLCTRCRRRTDRRGGKNIDHRFVCAVCTRGSAP